MHANLNDRREAHKSGFDVSDANATKKIVEREDLGRFLAFNRSHRIEREKPRLARRNSLSLICSLSSDWLQIKRRPRAGAVL